MLLCVLCGEFRHTLFLGLSKEEVPSILTDLPDVIEKILKNGESVSIRGLEPFHTSITSNSLNTRRMYCLTKYGCRKYISSPTVSLHTASAK